MRRSQRGKVTLPTTLEEQIETVVKGAKRELTEDWHASMRRPDDEVITTIKPFRLFDLPPELRARIFSFAVAVDDDYDFGFRWRPTVTTASKQFRAESMPIFYAEYAFVIRVISRFKAHVHMATNVVRPQLGVGQFISLKWHGHTGLNVADIDAQSARFRNITFVFEPPRPRYRIRHHVVSLPESFELRLVTVDEDGKTAGEKATIALYKEHLQAAISRPHFCGLTVDDIKGMFKWRS